jgi:hypothetical protein
VNFRKPINPDNLRRIDRKLARVQEAIEIAATEELIRASDAIADLAEMLVPVITGDVRDSIRWEWAGETSTVIGTDYPDKGITGLPIVVELEFGTATRPAKPFLHPAYHHEKPIFIATLNQRISNELRKVRNYL